jgi:pimeloyl-ACP methyl ester carboxylesterase
MKLLFKSMLVAVVLSCGTMQAQDIVGQWNGVLRVHGTKLRLIFHIEKTDEGYTSTLDSPDQGQTGFPVKTTSFDGSKVLLELPTLAAKYEGEFKIDSIIGTLTQNGMSFPMTLKKSSVVIPPQESKPLHVLSENIISEIKTIKLSDGEETTARLCFPKDGQINTIVIAVHGTGPFTYLTKRQGFNFYDVLADGFCGQGVGFFTYNRRGVDLGEKAPWFDKVDNTKYAKYLPHIEAADIETMITFLKNDQRFQNCKIILYGMSEGTIFASMVAERKKVKIDALFLHGYAHENMFDIIKWQNTGEGVMILANSIFDKNGDKVVDREEYESEDPTIAAYRGYLFQNLPFDSVDVVKDNVIDVKDIRAMRERALGQPFQELLMTKISENDGDWIWNNYVRVTIDWLKEHFALEPNKTRLLRVDIPIYVFHGKEDANVSAENVYDLEVRFKTCNKSNLKTFLFEKHNHGLNFQDWLKTKEYSEGLKKVFKTATEI